MYRLFGWINVAIVALIIIPIIVRWINNAYIKNAVLRKQLNKYRFLHKVFALLLLASMLTHAFLVFGAWQWHTGTVLGIQALITMSAGGLFFLLKKKGLFYFHRTMAALFVLLLLVHLIFPSAIYHIFG